jgi:hypothetical protein
VPNKADLNLLELEVGLQGRVDLANLWFWCGWDGSPEAWFPGARTKFSWPEETPAWVRGDVVVSQSPLDMGAPPDPETPAVELRLAPSITSRNEAELFGLSMPRFVIRLYLEKDGAPLGFVNVRRLATSIRLAPRWAWRTAKKKIPEFYRNWLHWTSPASLMRKNCCIADALLRPPPRFAGWTMLTADLAGAYGEAPVARFDPETGTAAAPGWRGTPYIRQVAMSGGGLCAQAACYMATALLHEHARGIHGVADVSSLVSDERYDEMRLTGLTDKQLRDYFRHAEVGLYAIWQCAFRERLPTFTVTFKIALQAYLRSGMPIILPVDSGRLTGQAHPRRDEKETIGRIRRRNGDFPGLWFNRGKAHARFHSVLVVGTNGGNLFAFQDPATLPFLVASSEELADVGIYRDFESGVLASCNFLPVTPRPVRMPLLEESIRGEKGPGRAAVASAARPLHAPAVLAERRGPADRLAGMPAGGARDLAVYSAAGVAVEGRRARLDGPRRATPAAVAGSRRLARGSLVLAADPRPQHLGLGCGKGAAGASRQAGGAAVYLRRFRLPRGGRLGVAVPEGAAADDHLEEAGGARAGGRLHGAATFAHQLLLRLESFLGARSLAGGGGGV